ncbi:MAG: hypothetical protein JNM69_01400 [Archangium sp.]|nr:hypothetical protein [Archangium sp.]
MRGVDLSVGGRAKGQTFEDSSPRAGGKSLFGLTPLDWIGKQLEVGTVRTSEVVSVEFLSMADAPVSRKTAPVAASPSATMTFGATPSTPAPKQEPRQSEAPRSWSPFPLGAVEMAEVAAALLNAVAHQGDVEKAVASQPLMKKRLSMALETCRLMLQTIDRAD